MTFTYLYAHLGRKLLCSRLLQLGRTVALNVSSWFSIAEALLRAQVNSCGISGEQSGGHVPNISVSLANHSIVYSTLIIIHHSGLVR
jgi:hypothetical protein